MLFLISAATPKSFLYTLSCFQTVHVMYTFKVKINAAPEVCVLCYICLVNFLPLHCQNVIDACTQHFVQAVVQKCAVFISSFALTCLLIPVCLGQHFAFSPLAQCVNVGMLDLICFLFELRACQHRLEVE